MSEAQIVLVTGATAGIGRAAALHLAARGHRVFATGRRTDALESLAAESALPIDTLVLDVTDPESIEAARAEVTARTGGHGVDVLVNNAGFGHLAPVELISDEDLRAQYETNVFGLMAVTRAFLGPMKARGRGRIVNVSSVGGRMTMPLMGAYNSTKYAVESLSNALRMELRPFGVDVVLVEPGLIRTEFAETSRRIVSKYDGRAGSYSPVFARADAIRALADRHSAPVDVVARALARSVEARRPRARYVVPFSGRLGLFLASVLPTCLVDSLLRRVTGFHDLGAAGGAREDLALPAAPSQEAGAGA